MFYEETRSNMFGFDNDHLTETSFGISSAISSECNKKKKKSKMALFVGTVTIDLRRWRWRLRREDRDAFYHAVMQPRAAHKLMLLHHSGTSLGGPTRRC